MSDTGLAAVRRRLERLAGTATGDIEGARARYASLAEGFALAADIAVDPTTVGGMPGERVTTPESREDMTCLFLHGGGYVVGSAAPYRHLVGEIARQTCATGLSLDYPLAPEHPFPQAIEAVVAAYRDLLEQGRKADRIVVAGDSAGGGLALALMLSLRDAGLPQPAAAWLISPLTDLDQTGETMRTRCHLDPIVSQALAAASADAYLDGASPRDPKASPLYADLATLPPLRIDVGSHEALLDDSIRLTRQAAIADVHVELTIWPGMPHIFPFFAPILDEGQQAVDRASAFFTAHLARH